MRLSMYQLPSKIAGRQLKHSVPKYLLLRNLTTVHEVWQEYKYGLYGNPSVESLVKKYARTWLDTAVDTNYYYRRKKIYDYINSAINNGKHEKKVLNQLEKLRNEQGWKLTTLQENIRHLSPDGLYLRSEENSGQSSVETDLMIMNTF